MRATALIDECLSSPLHAARIEHARGRRVVGYIGDDIPVELILAADALPVRLTGVPAPTPLADRYLESSFAPAHRSLLEAWLQGAFDFMDAIVFPRSSDSAQRLYYYVCELQRRGIHAGPRSLIYDVARVNRATSHAHTVAATYALAADLNVDPSRLDAAVARVRNRASLIVTLAELRTGSLAIAGSEALRAWRALQLDWTDDFERAVREWTASAHRQHCSPRLLFAGSTPPDERFHLAIEAVGGAIVDELYDESPASSAARWTARGASLEDIARRYRSARTTDVALLETPDLLLDRARGADASGVLLWLSEQDEGIVWEVPRQLERLRRAGIPVLALTRQRWDADATCLAAIQDFACSLRESS